MTEYQDIILDHYRDPQNYGTVQEVTHSFELRNLSCGDHITVYLRVVDGAVEEVGFEGSGCAISTAASSMVTEKITGMSVNRILALTKDDVLELLGIEISPARLKCALLSLEAIRNALKSEKNV